MAPFPRGQALVVGVGSYGDPRWDAPTATRDAQGAYDTLVDPALGGYGRGQAELLLNAAATREGVLLALRRLADRCATDSVALVSLTCHGAQGEDGLYYLATHGTRFTPPPQEQIVKGTGLHIGELARALRDIPARQLLLLVNACFAGHVGAALSSGAIAPDEAERASGLMLPDDSGNELLASGEGRAIITASRADQRSYFQADEQHSYFGQALLDALKGSAAGATSGYVGLYELYEGLYRQVRDATLRRLGAPQEPVLTLLQNVGPFPVASYPRASAGDGRIAQQPPANTLVRVVERDLIAAIGQDATAIKAEQGSTVTVDNSKLIDFGGATVMGGVRIGDVARGDIIKINSPTGAPDEQAPDPLRDLPILRERVATARNVDEDERDEAAGKLDLAHKALLRGDVAKARERVDEALGLLHAMDNGYVRSVVRKLDALREQL